MSGLVPASREDYPAPAGGESRLCCWSRQAPLYVTSLDVKKKKSVGGFGIQDGATPCNLADPLARGAGEGYARNPGRE